MLNVKPLADRVIVKPITAEEKSKSGIILPDTVEKKMERGEVVAVGPGKVLENGSRSASSVAVGNNVFFKKGYNSDEIKIDGTEYLVIEESDILAIIE